MFKMVLQKAGYRSRSGEPEQYQSAIAQLENVLKLGCRIETKHGFESGDTVHLSATPEYRFIEEEILDEEL
jgi:hypothetical protein